MKRILDDEDLAEHRDGRPFVPTGDDLLCVAHAGKVTETLEKMDRDLRERWLAAKMAAQPAN